MQALLKLSRAIDRLNAFVGRYAIWLIFSATAISAINASSASSSTYSSNAYLEVQWYLFAWSFLIAAGYTLLKREHVRIRACSTAIPEAAGRVRDPRPGVLPHAAVLMVLYFTIPLTLQVFPDGRDVEQPRRPDPLAGMAGAAAGLRPAAAAGLVGADQVHRVPQGSRADPSEKGGEKTDEEALIEALRQETARAAAARAQAH